ncbi:MAG: PAS domain S-box protein [Candidatus Desulfatibia sp.]|uniref:hybrid sensor histidine kinase/response regulator n=1 Tax=Candidatus Desulfatibia sp. TaxID=3101189 RepID=UPI002F2DC6F5
MIMKSRGAIVASNLARRKHGRTIGETCYEAWAQRKNPCPWCLAPQARSEKKPQTCEIEFEGRALKAYWIPVNNDMLVHYFLDISDCKTLEDVLSQQRRDFGERVKELNCLYSVSKVIEHQGTSMEDIFQEIVNIIPLSWQYPETTCARIRIGKKDYTSENFCETPFRQVSKIVIQRKQIGEVAVFYLKEMPKMDEGPFLIEERHLVNEIATKLAMAIERQIAVNAPLGGEDRFRSSFYHASIGICLLGLNKRYLKANSTFCVMVGYSEVELASKAFIDITYPDDIDATIEQLNKLRKGEIDSFQMENRYIHKQGHIIWAYASISAVRDANGNIIHYIFHVEDITEKKSLQQQLMQSEKLSSIGTFISGIAHELNNPLTAVLGFSQKLMDSENMPKEAVDDLEIISKQSKRTAKIVHELLKFSRTHKEGKVNLNINNAVETILGFYSHTFKADGIEIKRNLSFNLPKVFADSNQLQQVFTNIIVNAYYEMKKVHGKKVFTVKTVASDEHVFLIFENSGLPIPEKIMSKIFDPFFTSKKVGEGTGLGLYVSYGIIKDHGGEIKVENIGDSGARFTISLPVTEAKETKEVETKTKLTVPKGIRLLFVEDEETIREYVSRALAKEGISVHLAKDGKEAIELIEKTEYDVILSDIKMPRMNGFELCEWLHKHKPHYMERFVLATGVIDVEVEEYCRKYNCHPIIKPYSKEDILKTIAELAHKYNLGNKEV